MNFRVLSCLVFLLAGACAGTTKLGGDPSIRVVDSATLPEPERGDLSAPGRPYLIGAYDRLIIDVFGVEELSKQEIQADGGGRISFPLAGTIDAAGLTTAEVGKLIEQRLRDRFVRNPQVTVNLKEAVSQVVTVDGQVVEPGLYPVVGRMTLMRAVARAKGVSEYAKLEDVVIFRTVKGQRYAALYNLRAIRTGAYGDPEIFANDIVLVGDSKGRRIFKDIIQLIPALSTPIVVALQRI